MNFPEEILCGHEILPEICPAASGVCQISFKLWSLVLSCSILTACVWNDYIFVVIACVQTQLVFTNGNWIELNGNWMKWKIENFVQLKFHFIKTGRVCAQDTTWPTYNPRGSINLFIRVDLLHRLASTKFANSVVDNRSTRNKGSSEEIWH